MNHMCACLHEIVVFVGGNANANVVERCCVCVGQARSREVGRLASQFDLFRLLSFYYSSVGGFMNQVSVL